MSRESGVLRAFASGWDRVAHAKWLIVGTWAMTLAVAAPMALVLRGMLAAHLDASLAAHTARDGMNFDWWMEFLEQSGGIGQTFLPRIIGFAAPLGNLSGLADARSLPTAVAVTVGASLLLSLFLAGGILDRLARGRAVGASAFFAACGVFFFRFVRLGIIAGLVYWLLLFTKVHTLLFDGWYSSATTDTTVERTAFITRALLYLAFGMLVSAANILFDYAKIRAVVEDRRSMVMALLASLRFVRRNLGAVIALYLLNLVLFLGLLLIYFLVAPGIAGDWRMWLALIVGQLYIIGRCILRLQFAASQIALFQRRLAHAQYTATPTPTWPDSPAAEAMGIRGRV